MLTEKKLRSMEIRIRDVAFGQQHALTDLNHKAGAGRGATPNRKGSKEAKCYTNVIVIMTALCAVLLVK